MGEKFKNKYRIPSARLPSWDYGWNAAYYVTICTGHRVEYFGKIENGQMALSVIGKMAEQYWREIPNHFPFVILDAYVIMPNHVHGIIIINKTDNGDVTDDDNVETPKLGVSTLLSNHNRSHQNDKKWKPGTLGVIINQFKRIVTMHARKINDDFSWQSRFYDRIIRNENEYNRIQQYIINNPAKWAEDQNNQDGLWI